MKFEYPTPTGHARAQDGTKLPFYESGQGDTIFIFNGFSCNQANLQHLIRLLAKKYRVVSFDYKGHGKADNPKNYDYVNISGFINDAKRVLEESETKSAILLGYSLGTQMMLEYTKHYPKNVEALIALNGTYGNVFSNFMNTDIFAMLLPSLSAGQNQFGDIYSAVYRTVLSLPYAVKFELLKYILLDNNKCDPKDIEPFIEQLKHLDVHLLIHLANSMHRHSALDYLKTIEQPALLIGGESDLFAPLKVTNEAKEKMQNAEVLVVPNGTHNSNLEQHDFITDKIIRFLDKKTGM